MLGYWVILPGDPRPQGRQTSPSRTQAELSLHSEKNVRERLRELPTPHPPSSTQSAAVRARLARAVPAA